MAGLTNVIFAPNDSLGRIELVSSSWLVGNYGVTSIQVTVKNLVTARGEGITAERETLVWGTTGFRN